MAETAVQLARKSLNTGIDPNGRAYAPLKSRHGAPLMKTLKLYYGISATSSTTGFVLYDSAPYAGYHQHGVYSRRESKKTYDPIAGTASGGFERVAGALVPKRYRGRSAGKYGRKPAYQVHLPQRAFFPTDSKLPQSWFPIIDVGNEFIRRYMEP